MQATELWFNGIGPQVDFFRIFPTQVFRGVPLPPFPGAPTSGDELLQRTRLKHCVRIETECNLWCRLPGLTATQEAPRFRAGHRTIRRNVCSCASASRIYLPSIHASPFAPAFAALGLQKLQARTIITELVVRTLPVNVERKCSWDRMPSVWTTAARKQWHPLKRDFWGIHNQISTWWEGPRPIRTSCDKLWQRGREGCNLEGQSPSRPPLLACGAGGREWWIPIGPWGEGGGVKAMSFVKRPWLHGSKNLKKLRKYVSLFANMGHGLNKFVKQMMIFGKNPWWHGSNNLENYVSFFAKNAHDSKRDHLWQNMQMFGKKPWWYGSKNVENYVSFFYKLHMHLKCYHFLSKNIMIFVKTIMCLISWWHGSKNWKTMSQFLQKWCMASKPFIFCQQMTFFNFWGA